MLSSYKENDVKMFIGAHLHYCYTGPNVLSVKKNFLKNGISALLHATTGTSFCMAFVFKIFTLMVSLGLMLIPDFVEEESLQGGLQSVIFIV